jgi:hypothetical protein
MKFVGLFFNREREASAAFDAIRAEYEATKVGAMHAVHGVPAGEGWGRGEEGRQPPNLGRLTSMLRMLCFLRMLVEVVAEEQPLKARRAPACRLPPRALLRPKTRRRWLPGLSTSCITLVSGVRQYHCMRAVAGGWPPAGSLAQAGCPARTAVSRSVACLYCRAVLLGSPRNINPISPPPRTLAMNSHCFISTFFHPYRPTFLHSHRLPLAPFQASTSSCPLIPTRCS